MVVKLNEKGNKELEMYIDGNIRKGHIATELKGYELFAYDHVEIPTDTEKKSQDKTAFYVNKEEGKIIRCADGIMYDPVKLEVKDGVDPITAYVNHVKKSEQDLGDVTLATWAYKYILENFDAECQLQFENIGQMGDPESLFSGDDACKKLEDMFKDPEE